MLAIIKLLWDICCLRKGPQDLPYSIVFFVLLIIVSSTISISQLMFQQTFIEAASQTFLMLALTMVFNWCVLKIKHLGERFIQTTSALIGTGTVINVLVYPLLLFHFYILRPDEEHLLVVSFSLVVLCLIIGLNVWAFIIAAHIFRNAINSSLFAGLFVTFAYVAVHILAYMVFLSP